MNVLIIYDSEFGNTEKIARAIEGALASHTNVTTLRVSDVRSENFTSLQLLIIGSPTQRFRPTIAIGNLLKEISNIDLNEVGVIAFDTRLTWDEISKTPVLAFFVKLFGGNAYAAKLIADSLKKKGGKLVAAPEGFYVTGMKGPLVEGELERAMSWATQIFSRMQ